MTLQASTEVIIFDFAGALHLARSFWQYSDSIAEARVRRSALADQAALHWLGRFGREFAERTDVEQVELDGLRDAFRTAATEWARAWKEATDRKNLLEWAAECEALQRAHSDRSLVQKVGDALPMIGSSPPPMPPRPLPVPLPVPPAFLPMCAR